MHGTKGQDELLEVHGEIEGIYLMKAMQSIQADIKDHASKTVKSGAKRKVP